MSVLSVRDLRHLPMHTVLWFPEHRVAWQKFQGGIWRGTNGASMSSEELGSEQDYCEVLNDHAALSAAWANGHESGFWNGRESAGSGYMELCGRDHAKANNPYGATA